MPASRTRIGSTLQEARLALGKTVEEVSRDTNIKPEYLRALEGESFSSLRGDVYVRSFLRSYSAYLGLDSEEVVASYDRRPGTVTIIDAPTTIPTLGEPLPEGGLGVPRRRITWPIVAGVAVVLILTLAAIGALSQSGAPPEAEAPVAVTPSVASVSLFVSVRLKPSEPVHAFVVSDGTTVFDGELEADAPQLFTADSLIRVWIEKGGVTEAWVNGENVGIPGDDSKPYEASFTPQDFRGTSSAPA